MREDYCNSEMCRTVYEAFITGWPLAKKTGEYEKPKDFLEELLYDLSEDEKLSLLNDVEPTVTYNNFEKFIEEEFSLHLGGIDLFKAGFECAGEIDSSDSYFRTSDFGSESTSDIDDWFDIDEIAWHIMDAFSYREAKEEEE